MCGTSKVWEHALSFAVVIYNGIKKVMDVSLCSKPLLSCFVADFIYSKSLRNTPTRLFSLERSRNRLSLSEVVYKLNVFASSYHWTMSKIELHLVFLRVSTAQGVRIRSLPARSKFLSFSVNIFSKPKRNPSFLLFVSVLFWLYWCTFWSTFALILTDTHHRWTMSASDILKRSNGLVLMACTITEVTKLPWNQGLDTWLYRYLSQVSKWPCVSLSHWLWHALSRWHWQPERVLYVFEQTALEASFWKSLPFFLVDGT